MTLIAASRTPEGIVIHADSQETVGDYRIEVDKILSQTMGQFHVLIAGAGQPGTLLDSFPIRLQRRINDKVKTLSGFVSVVEKELVRFYEKDLYLCPDADKNVCWLIAAWDSKTQQYDAWIAENIVMKPIPADVPILLGWEHALYVSIAKRFYFQATSTPQAVVAGVYLMTVAEETANCVKGPIKIAVVNEGGIKLEDAGYARRLQDRLAAYEKKANSVFLACADTTVSVPALEDAINQFRRVALDLHRDQIDEVAKSASLFDFAHGNPLRKLPFVPMEILEKGFRVEHDREVIAETQAEHEGHEAWVRETGINSLTKSVQCSKCHSEVEVKISCHGPFDHRSSTSCPNCKAGIEVEWVFNSGSFA